MTTRYDIDYKKLAVMLLPIVLRKAVITVFVYVLVKPVQMTANAFDKYRTDTDYRLSHNCQVCYLRAMLNDKFDPLQRRIVITDVPAVPSLLLYRRSQNRFQMAPLRSSGTAIKVGRRGYGGIDGYDFSIIVPQELLQDTIYNEDRLRALVDTYKLASKRYTIQYQ